MGGGGIRDFSLSQYTRLDGLEKTLETSLKHTFRFAQKERDYSGRQKQKSKPTRTGTETNPSQGDCLSNQVVWGLAPTEITDNDSDTCIKAGSMKS